MSSIGTGVSIVSNYEPWTYISQSLKSLVEFATICMVIYGKTFSVVRTCAW